MPEAIRVLVMEDEPALLEVLSEELGSRGHVVASAPRVKSAIDQLTASEFDVAILDMNLPDGSGIDVLRYIAAEGLPTESIVLTGNAEIQSAIDAMKLGAYDYLTKPSRLDELEILVSRAAEKARLRRENSGLKLRLERQERGQSIVTEDPAMKGLLGSLARVAASDLPVLVEGETGTGKELVARGVHQQSPRAQQPFVAVNCGAFPESLVESELFGHEKGAFTGAIARRAGVFELADRGSPLPRRGGRDEPRRPGEAATGHRDGGVYAGGWHSASSSRHSHRVGHQQGPARRGPAWHLPRGSLLQARAASHCASLLSGSERGMSRCWRRIFSVALARDRR